MLRNSIVFFSHTSQNNPKYISNLNYSVRVSNQAFNSDPSSLCGGLENEYQRVDGDPQPVSAFFSLSFSTLIFFSRNYMNSQVFKTKGILEATTYHIFTESYIRQLRLNERVMKGMNRGG